MKNIKIYIPTVTFYMVEFMGISSANDECVDTPSANDDFYPFGAA
jgi:hypothetical protein